MASPQDGSPEASYDPMAQFAELAGDVRDPYPMFAGIRADTPVLHVELGAGSRYRHDEKAPPITTLYSVTSYQLARQVLTDNVRFSSAGYATTMGPVMGRTILEMDPPEHQRYRALVARAFRARMLEQWSDAIIGSCVHELLDDFAGDGQADLVRQLTFPFPVRVIARVLGLPEADWPRFLRLSTELIAVMRNYDRAVAASKELRGYFAGIIADRRRDPRDDLVGQLIEAEVDGHRLSDEEIYPFLLLLLPAGAETTYRSSSNLLFGLLSHPEQLAAVRADRGLLPRAIEEGLRWETPLMTVARVATQDVELGGVTIPAGGFVALSLGSANRDPERFDSPDSFDLYRESQGHLSFGDGAHRCLGMHLARLETSVLVNAVLDRLPGLRLDSSVEDQHIHGMIFRSPPELRVRWNPGGLDDCVDLPPDGGG